MNLLKKILHNDYWFALFFLGLLTFVFFLPIVLGIQSLFEAYPVFYDKHNLVPPQIKTPWVIDGGTHVRSIVPATILGVKLIKEGIWPNWNPYDGAGEAGMTNNSYLYNPLRFIYFSFFTGLRAFDFYFLLRFVIAGFGVFIFLKELGLSRRASLFGSVAYMFSGYFIAFLTYPFLDIDAFVPYLLFAFERYFKNSNLKYIALSSLFISLTILGGHPQVTIISGLFFGSYFLYRVFSESNLRIRHLLHLRNFLIMMTGGILIALPYLVDIFSNFRQGLTIYNYGPYLALKHGLEHANLIYLLHFFINPSTFLEFAIGGHLFNRFTDIVPYVGVTILLLFLLSFFIKNKSKIVIYFYIFLAFAILKIFGFPIVNLIGKLPILEQIGWHKMYGPTSLAFALTAAFSYESLMSFQINFRKFLYGVGLIAFIFVIVFLLDKQQFLVSYTPHLDFLSRRPETIAAALHIFNRFPGSIRQLIFAFINNGKYFVYFLFIRQGVFLALAALLIWLAVGKKSARAHLFIFIFLIVELWIYMPKIRDGFRYFNPYIKPPFVEFLQEKAGGDLFGVISTDYTFPVSLGSLYGIRKFQTTSAIFPKRFWYFIPDTIRKNDHDYFKLLPQDVIETPKQFFNAANLRYLLTEDKSLNPGQSFKLVYDKDLKIYENENVLPRAYVVFNKETADSVLDAKSKFYSEKFDPHTSVILEDNNEINLSLAGAGSSKTEIVSYKPNKVDLRVNLTADGILVLSDTYLSGWRAFVDGKLTKIYPANVLFRGIFLPQGNHQITFIYKPNWLLPSLVISLATMILALYAIFLRKPFKI